MIDYKILKKKLELLEKGTVVLIAGHKNADYDSITSCLALSYILSKLGYVSYVLLEDKDLDKTNWLNTTPVITSYLSDKPFNFIMLDADRKERLGSFQKLFDAAETTITIDHHEANKNEATYTFVDEKISSTAEIIANLAKEFPDILDKNIATLLYAGIVSDTSSFYKRTTPSTMKIASTLLEYDVDNSFVIKNTTKNISLREATILSHMFANLVYDEFHYIIVDRKEEIFTHVPYGVLFKKCASYIYEIRDIDVFGLFVIELDGSVSGLLRSNCETDVDELARSMGGGGHKKAAGFEINLGIECIIGNVKKYLHSQS